MVAIVTRNVPLLTDKQRIIYDRIMLAVLAGQEGFFYFSCEVRSNNGIALAIASSEIAETLLDGCRTVHSAFQLPLNIQNNPVAGCKIKKTIIHDHGAETI